MASATHIRPEFVAAHEAGHATVFLLLGVPVCWVEIKRSAVSQTVTRLGFTETQEDRWMASSPLPLQAKVLRRVIGKAGGIAGELMARVYEVAESTLGGQDDVAQIGAGLRDVGLLERGASATHPLFLATIVTEALRLLSVHYLTFDNIMRRLIDEGRIDAPTCPPAWSDDDDRRLFDNLTAVKGQLAGSVKPDGG